MVIQNFAVLTLQRTETIDSRQSQQFQVVRGIEVGMSAISAIHAFELVTTAISPVPSVADVAVLRCVRWALALKPSPAFLAMPRQHIRNIGVKPMGQPSVVNTRERPALATFDVLQIFDTEHPNIRPINLLNGLTHARLDLSMGMFLALGKGTNVCYHVLSNILPIGDVMRFDLRSQNAAPDGSNAGGACASAPGTSREKPSVVPP